jgi:hypothetical protein
MHVLLLYLTGKLLKAIAITAPDYRGRDMEDMICLRPLED